MNDGPQFESLLLVRLLGWCADVGEKWLPMWVIYPIGILWLILLLVLGGLEYGFRYLVTPAKYWRQ